MGVSIVLLDRESKPSTSFKRNDWRLTCALPTQGLASLIALDSSSFALLLPKLSFEARGGL